MNPIVWPGQHTQHLLEACKLVVQTHCQQFSGKRVYHVQGHPLLQLLLPEQRLQSFVGHSHL